MVIRCEICNFDLCDEYSYKGHLQGKKHLLNSQRVQRRDSLIEKSIFVRAPIPIIHQKNIIEFFSSFGEIAKHNAGPNYLIIEYTSREPVNFLLRKPIFFAGVKLQIKRRIINSPKDPFQTTAKNKNKEQSKEEADAFELCYKNLKNELEEKPSFNDQLSFLLNKIELTEEDVERDYEPICTNLDDVFRQVFPKCKAHRFGSTASGLCFKKSDLDVYMDIGMAISENENGQELTMRKVFIEAKKVMYKRNAIFGNVVPISRAKTPIVKFCHLSKHISCDLSFKNNLGVHNSQLIKQYLHFDPRLKPAMMLLKYWAKEFQLTRSGKISNYALVMLFIFYLQQPPVALAPAVIELQKNCEAELVEGWQVNSDKDYRYSKPENENTIPEILCGFFKFYADFNFDNNVVCPLDGMTYPKSIFEKQENLPGSMQRLKDSAEKQEYALNAFAKNNPMSLQDPIELTHNITANVTVQVLEYFRTLCAAMAVICKNTMHVDEGKNLLAQLFDHPEQPKTKKSQLSVYQIHLPLPRGVPKNADVSDEEKFVADDRYSTVLSCARKIFEGVFKFQVETHPALKQLKVEAISDVHTSDHEKIVWHCTSKHCTWRERKTMKFAASAGMSTLEKEITISDAILKNNLDTGKQSNVVLDFLCKFERKEDADLVILTLLDRKCSKKSFREMIPFLQSKLPPLVLKMLEAT